MPSGRLNDRTALITGAASGIGETTARRFGSEGASLLLCDIDERGAEVAERIEHEGGTAAFLRCDVTSADDVAGAVDATVARYGRLDCAFNNAGTEGTQEQLVEFPEKAWERTLRVNLTSVWLCLKCEIRQMLKQGGGRIVNTASISGLISYPRWPAYIASKHGVIGLTKAAAVEYADRGVAVNAVCPGYVETPMVVERGERAQPGSPSWQRLADKHAIGRLAKAEEIAETVLWLCAEAPPFLVGSEIVVDGGYTAQ